MSDMLQTWTGYGILAGFILAYALVIRYLYIYVAFKMGARRRGRVCCEHPVLAPGNGIIQLAVINL